MESTWRGMLLAFSAVLLFSSTLARAASVYSNDFENAATAFNGLSASGTLLGLSPVSLPTDSGGLSSPNQSMWLGKIGENLAKSGTTSEIVTLSLSGLGVNTHYN